MFKVGTEVKLVSFPKYVGKIEVVGDARVTGGVAWFYVNFDGQHVSAFIDELEAI
jgi:hypothetical protein